MKVWMGAAFSCFFVVENNPPAFFWSRFWRFQSGLWDDRTHRQQYQMNITPTSHMGHSTARLSTDKQVCENTRGPGKDTHV